MPQRKWLLELIYMCSFVPNFGGFRGMQYAAEGTMQGRWPGGVNATANAEAMVAEHRQNTQNGCSFWRG